MKNGLAPLYLIIAILYSLFFIPYSSFFISLFLLRRVWRWCCP